jgi:predicted Zn-dependent protease
LLSQGRVDDAVAAFRAGLAHTPQNNQLRVSLGLALIQTGHHGEASSYLSQASKAEPSRGAVWMGLAEVALAGGDKARALELYRLALSKEWQPADEPLRWSAYFSYATLLGETGKTSEAVSLLMLLIEQKGDDPALGRKAADAVKSIGSPQQVEEAMRLLTKQFPADAGAWLRLGDARFTAEKDSAALEAYSNAVQIDSSNDEAKQAVARVEEVLRLDPTRRGLPVRERARRWDLILQRMLAAVDKCGASAAAEEARPLLKKRAASLELSDQKMTAANKLWLTAPPECRTDPVLSHIMAKLGE